MKYLGQLRRNQAVALAAIVAGGLAAIGTTLTWFTIEIGGIDAPGGSATGMEGRDGWTVLAGAVAAGIAAGLLIVQQRPMVAKVLLLVAGGVTSIVAVAGILDATGKDREVEQAFGIAAERVKASVGSGLWLVLVGGIVGLAAGAASRSGADD